MLETDLQLGRYGITARLFKLISDMPKDKKLILLKQLIGDDVTAQLPKNSRSFCSNNWEPCRPLSCLKEPSVWRKMILRCGKIRANRV
jgi:hypothetical protein